MNDFLISGFADEISSDTTIQFETLNKIGIKYFEPRGIDEKNISLLTDDEVIKLKEKMDKYGIKASSIGSPIGKIKITDDFDAHFEVFKRVVKTAKMLNAKYIRMFSFYQDGEGDWTKEERDDVIKKLTKLIDYAKKEDVVLLHENEKDIYGDTIERCIDLMETLYCDNFKAVFDPANFVQCNENTKDAFEKLEKYIEYMHIKDSKYDGTVVPAGEGEGNIPYIITRLKEKGYKGFLSLEPHLGSFTGLGDLELDDKMEKLEKSTAEKFIIAHNALKKIIGEIE